MERITYQNGCPPAILGSIPCETLLQVIAHRPFQPLHPTVNQGSPGRYRLPMIEHDRQLVGRWPNRVVCRKGQKKNFLQV